MRKSTNPHSAAPGHVRKLPATEVAQLAARYKAGATVYELAAEFGINRQTVAGHLRRQGVTMRGQPMTEAEKQLAIRLYGEGWSLAKVGDRFGREHTVIRDVLKHAGVPRRDTHGRKR